MKAPVATSGRNSINIPVLPTGIREGIEIGDWSSETEVSEFDLSESSGPLNVKYLYGEIAEGWVACELLEISIEKDEVGFYVASDNVFDVYGEGETRDQAIEDYITSLIDYYELLEHDVKEGANPFTKRLFNYLKLHFDRASNCTI